MVRMVTRTELTMTRHIVPESHHIVPFALFQQAHGGLRGPERLMLITGTPCLRLQ
jgi:hypothetical protein